MQILSAALQELHFTCVCYQILSEDEAGDAENYSTAMTALPLLILCSR